MYKISILLFFAFNSMVYSQSLEDDLKEMHKKFEGVSNISVDLESEVFEDNESKFKIRNSIKKSGGKYLYQLDNRAMLINDKYLVVVDDRNRNISYDKWTKTQAHKLANMNVPLPKDLLKKYPTVIFMGEKSGVRHYSLHNENEQMSRLDIFYDIKNNADLTNRNLKNYLLF